MAVGRVLDRCIYCSAPNTTEEHIVADWVVRAFLRTKKPDLEINGTFVDRNQIRVTSGEPVTTTQVVCQPCNNNWLSSIDQAAARALKPLIQGRTEVVLDADAQTAVAAWVFKCALTFDVLQHGANGDLSSLRTTFARDRTAPPGCTIYLGPAPPAPITIPNIPNAAGLALFGVRPTLGTINLTVSVEMPDGTTQQQPPTSIATPGWTVMLGRLNAILSGRRGPIIPTPEWAFQCVWPPSTEPVTLTSVPPEGHAAGQTAPGRS